MANVKHNLPEPWPPAAYALPDTTEAIERGRIVQGKLIAERLDDTRAGRLRRILNSVPGVTAAARLREETVGRLNATN